MQDSQPPISLVDLCDAADVTPRTVRYYIQQGLLPPADGAGQSASYNAGHLGRLQLIRRLRDHHLPLAEIRARLDALTSDDEEQLRRGGASPPAPPPSSAADYIRAVLGGASARPPSGRAGSPGPLPPPPPMPSAPAFGSRALWEHHTLHKDIELHVRRPLDTQTNRRLERLLEAARAIFNEPSASKETP